MQSRAGFLACVASSGHRGPIGGAFPADRAAGARVDQRAGV